MRTWFLGLLVLVITAGCAPLDGPAAKMQPAVTTPAETARPQVQPTAVIDATRPPEVGIITGKVSIGPLTPVERVGQPTPTIAAEVFTSRKLNILQEDGKTLVTSVPFKADGTYRVELPPGTYVLALPRQGLERGRDLPKTVQLAGGQTILLDIEIDTGMR